MPDITEVLADLDAESADLDTLVAELPADAWALPTPADGWTIAHQISHLAWTDQVAHLSATDRHLFVAALTRLLSDPDGFVDRRRPRASRRRPRCSPGGAPGESSLREALAVAPPGETPLVRHGDVAGVDGDRPDHGDLGPRAGHRRHPRRHPHSDGTAAARRPPGEPHDRVQLHGARPARCPSVPIRLELTAPDGTTWSYGPDDATNVVTGSALDFCLVVTHRRHRDDVELTATGPVADEWLNVAQTFAGPPGRARAPDATCPMSNPGFDRQSKLAVTRHVMVRAHLL